MTITTMIDLLGDMAEQLNDPDPAIAEETNKAYLLVIEAQEALAKIQDILGK